LFRHLYGFIVCLVLLFLSSGCSVEKNTGASRFYHGLTARYNIYFNGLESYRMGVDKISSGHVDDFGDLLYVFEYSNTASAQLGAADMERAVQKASKLITLKSITARPEKKDNQPLRDKDFYKMKEYTRWVDDSYLLMAKARFYQRDFEQARATIVFNNDNTTDRDIRTEGSIWLSRIHAETGNYSEALRVLTETGNVEEMPVSLRAMYHTTHADILLRQKRLEEAIVPIEKAIETSRGKRQKYRLTFLLGQVCGETGKPEMAIDAFSNVIKMRPPYEVEFNARIGMATVFDASAGSSEKIRGSLLAMTKDEKNREYLDQVFYALGRLSENEGNTDEAISYYRQAARSEGSSTNGRGRACLALADHYFDIPDYLNARTYYDSALFFLNRQYPDYESIRSRSANLGELVTHLEIIRTEDSLRRVAAMNARDRSILIAGIIEKVTEEERLMANEERTSDMYNLGQFYENERRFRENIEQEGQWYFYNQAALTFGRTEFRRRWGDRQLEDNWRRQNKRIVQTDRLPDEETPGVADSLPLPDDPKNIQFYLKNLPLNDSLLAISREKTVNALFAAGSVYADKFNDTPRASASWHDLISRFGDHRLVPQTWYQLYLLYHENDPLRAETYRQNLLSGYPDSDFSLILTDPDYFRKMREAELITDKMYERAYELFIGGNLEQARLMCDDIAATTPDHPLIPKVKLLRSLTLAGTGNEREYRESLSALIKNHPSTPEAARASELMASLDREMPDLRVEEDRQIAAEIYLFDPEKPHLFVLLIENPTFNINQATFDVINFNIDNYPNRNLRAEGSLVDNKFITVTVSSFTSANDAMEYYTSFNPLTLIRNSSPATTKTFVISTENMETLLKDMDPARYIVFFREKYLEGNEQAK
jgi:tetratricopeptide (TPR) repeat protein